MTDLKHKFGSNLASLRRNEPNGPGPATTRHLCGHRQINVIFWLNAIWIAKLSFHFLRPPEGVPLVQMQPSPQIPA